MMARSILSFLNKKTDGVHEAAYLLAFFAVLSQLLALVRDRTLAGYFGAGEILDTYYAAFRIPDILFALVASAVSISVLVPLLSGLIMSDEARAKRILNTIFSAFFSFLSIASIVIAIIMPFLLSRFFPGFSPGTESYHDLLLLSRIMLLSPILLGLSNLLASLTQIFNNFFVYALSPLLYNIGIIFGVVFFYPIFGIEGLAYGVVLGALLHLAIQVPVIVHYRFLPRFTSKWNLDELKNIVAVSFPRAITMSIQQISVLFLVSLASVMVPGSIAVFNFSLNLQSVPLTIIGASYSLAAFPTLSRLFGSGDRDNYLNEIGMTLKHIIFWSVPALVLFIVLRAQIVRTVLGSGEFGWDATRLTAASLAVFVLSATAQSLVLLFVRSYYAAGKTLKPLIINTLSSFLIIAFAYIFYKLFYSFEFIRFFIESILKVSNIQGSSVLALSFAYSAGMFINMFLLWFNFNKDFGSFGIGINKSIFHTLSGSVVMGFVAYLSLKPFAVMFDQTTLVGIFLQGFCAGVIGIIAGIFILIILKNEEIKEVWSVLHKKIWKTKVLMPTPEEL